MSSALPSRGQCIQVTDNYCQCPWFVSTLLDQHLCGLCGHGIHAHVDYVSMVVNYYPANQCAAYVQKTPLAQRCTCEAQLCDHVATNNPYRMTEPWKVLDYFPDNNIPSSNVGAIGFSNGAVNDPYTPSSMSFSSADSDAVTQSSHDANLMPTARAPVFSPSPRHAFSPSSGVENIRFASTSISSPSSSASSTIQSDITQIQAYSSNHYFVHPDHFINTYARQSDDDATDENLHYHGGSNVMYGSTPEA
ncbi:hypothetical protein EV421DRAFT_1740588 [Armillaria borealis]|uniref:Uncharacterized protein n=1 Tax=Armillaria borealis TaxID=47425 RepID=A0AA39J607_9AGAR|nr:hypothetical protein EV421DRAFT_1740588 [Armillaria borealis]